MKKNYLNAQTQVVEMEITNAIMETSFLDVTKDLTEGDDEFGG